MGKQISQLPEIEQLTGAEMFVVEGGSPLKTKKTSLLNIANFLETIATSDGLIFFKESSANGAVTLSPNSTADKVDVAISPLGAGAFSLKSASVNRGEYSVDLQLKSSSDSLVSQGYASFLGCGENNCVFPDYSSVLSGKNNNIKTDSEYSILCGGERNGIENTAPYAFIGGGSWNFVKAKRGCVLGGYFNTSEGEESATVGGSINYSKARNCFIGGGKANEITESGSYSFILAGHYNSVEASRGGIFGGYKNTISAPLSWAIGSNASTSREFEFAFGINSKFQFSQLLVNGFTYFKPPENTIWVVEGKTLAIKEGDLNSFKSWKFALIVKNIEGTITLSMAAPIEQLGDSPEDWQLAIDLFSSTGINIRLKDSQGNYLPSSFNVDYFSDLKILQAK